MRYLVTFALLTGAFYLFRGDGDMLGSLLVAGGLVALQLTAEVVIRKLDKNEHETKRMRDLMEHVASLSGKVIEQSYRLEKVELLLNKRLKTEINASKISRKA